MNWKHKNNLDGSAVLHLDIKICCIKEGRFINLQKSLHRSPGWPPKTIKKRLPAYQHLCIPASQMHISDSLHPCIFCTPGVLASSDPGASWPDSDLVKAFIMFYQIIKSNHCLPVSLMNSRNDWILSGLVDLMPVSDANCFMMMISHVQQLPKVQSLHTRQFHKNTFFGRSYCPKLIRGPGANRN